MSQRKWMDSREAGCWFELTPGRAGDVLLANHGDGAGAEALLRAYLAERDHLPDAAAFWLKVHAKLPAARREASERALFRTLATQALKRR